MPSTGMEFDKAAVAFVMPVFDEGLGAVRSLGRVGVRVVGLHADSSAHGLKSRYCTSLTCPDPVSQPDELLEFLLDRGRTLDRPGILFATTDLFVLFVSRHRDALSECFRFAMPSADTIESVIDKRRQYALAERLGIPYPQTLYPENIADVERIKNDIEYPVFVKPHLSHEWRAKFPEIKGFKAQNPTELLHYFPPVCEAGKGAVIQSIVPGPTTNLCEVSSYIDQDGKLLAQFTSPKIRQYPTEFGIGTLCESLYSSEVAELGIKFLRGIGYKGTSSVEFKRDERDGHLKLIELNPRFFQQISLVTRSGINLPLVEYLDLTDQKPEPQVSFLEHVKWFDAIRDVKAFLDCHRNGELSVLQWIKSFYDAKAFAKFAWDDPLPFLYACGHSLLKVPSWLLRRMKAPRRSRRRIT